MDWAEWLSATWSELASGARVPVPSALEHPSAVGFAPARIAEPAGQVGDWVMPLADGSRLHVHEMAGGELFAHRDAVDPGRGVVAAVGHVATETRAGRAGVVAAVAGLCCRALRGTVLL